MLAARAVADHLDRVMRLRAVNGHFRVLSKGRIASASCADMANYANRSAMNIARGFGEYPPRDHRFVATRGESRRRQKALKTISRVNDVPPATC
jgi:hypothetical protein